MTGWPCSRRRHPARTTTGRTASRRSSRCCRSRPSAWCWAPPPDRPRRPPRSRPTGPRRSRPSSRWSEGWPEDDGSDEPRVRPAQCRRPGDDPGRRAAGVPLLSCRPRCARSGDQLVLRRFGRLRPRAGALPLDQEASDYVERPSRAQPGVPTRPGTGRRRPSPPRSGRARWGRVRRDHPGLGRCRPHGHQRGPGRQRGRGRPHERRGHRQHRDGPGHRDPREPRRRRSAR